MLLLRALQCCRHLRDDVGVETRPKPVIRDPTDAIIRVKLAGICGSELHMYRGVQKTAAGHIMGHEFIGVIEETGSDVNKFAVSDEVVSLFSLVWYVSSLVSHQVC